MVEIKLVRQFKTAVNNYLEEVNSNNFGDKYDGLARIVVEYGRKGIQPITVVSTFIEISRDKKLNDGQDEILLDISSRVEGKCTPSRIISW